MKERFLSAKEVAENMGISLSAARTRMAEMPGCIDVGEGKNRILRVPESGLETWQANRVLRVIPNGGKIARRNSRKP